MKQILSPVGVTGAAPDILPPVGLTVCDCEGEGDTTWPLPGYPHKPTARTTLEIIVGNLVVIYILCICLTATTQAEDKTRRLHRKCLGFESHHQYHHQPPI